MKAIKFFSLVLLLVAVTGCTQTGQPTTGAATDTATATGSTPAATPAPPSVETATARIVQFAEGTDAMKSFHDFLQTQGGLPEGAPTVAAESVQIGSFDAEKKCFPVTASLFLASKAPDGQLKRLDSGRATGKGCPDIPGAWKFSFTPAGNDQWTVDLMK